MDKNFQSALNYFLASQHLTISFYNFFNNLSEFTGIRKITTNGHFTLAKP